MKGDKAEFVILEDKNKIKEKEEYISNLQLREENYLSARNDLIKICENKNENRSFIKKIFDKKHWVTTDGKRRFIELKLDNKTILTRYIKPYVGSGDFQTKYYICKLCENKIWL